MTAEAQAIATATPGRILVDEFLEPLGISQAELARRTGIPRSSLNEIIRGKRPINAETALALGIVFRMTPQFWLNLQNTHDLRRVRPKEAEMRSRIKPVALV